MKTQPLFDRKEMLCTSAARTGMRAQSQILIVHREIIDTAVGVLMLPKNLYRD